MKIIICGCSFYSTDSKRPGTHFTELLANYFNATLINIAKTGASNFVIRLQIDYAIEQNPDLIIVGFTSADRIDYKIDYTKEFDPHTGIKNIEYPENKLLPNEFDKNLWTVNSSPINTLLQPGLEIQPVVESYFKRIYDHKLAEQRDFYIAQSGVYVLKDSNVPFIINASGLMNYDPFWSDSFCSGPQCNPWNYIKWDLENKKSDTHSIYHTSVDAQVELSKHWIKVINDKLKSI